MPRLPLPDLILLLAGLAGLAGCAGPGEFPSLAPRPTEQSGAAETPPAPPPPAPGTPDAAIAARLTPILAAAEAGHGRFLSELDAARPIVDRAAGATPGGEAWVAGQQALSRLSAARGALTGALADLDALRREQADNGNPAGRAMLDQAGDRLAALDAEERARLADLAGKIG